jgi:hypothetical protein
MKIFRLIIFVISVAVCYWSCQRELFFDGVSSGKLKKDASGNCLPVKIQGLYIIDTILNQSDFVEVEADVVTPGTYDIYTDTANGYSFRGTGNAVKGSNIIRLTASGKPRSVGINSFKAVYGNSTCIFTVKVSNTPVAVFTLGGAPDFCTGVFENGSYIKDTPLSGANSVTLQVDVSVPGLWSATASTNNGFQFSGNGLFTSTGVQSITLFGSGTPLKDGVTNVAVTNTVSNCNFPLTVLATIDNKAIFSFDGTPGNCISYIVNGVYYAGMGVNISHSVSLNVNVTKTGIYSVNTNTANGLNFSTSGIFTSLGNQTITVNAKGTPVKQESTAFIPNTGTQTCNYYVDVLPLPPPAVFTLSGAPNGCAPVTINGFYIHSKPLDAANTVIIQADVATPGSYNFSTNTVNGISFTASGVFAAAGLQNIILRGTGVPANTGTTVVTPRYVNSACNFTITVQ